MTRAEYMEVKKKNKEARDQKERDAKNWKKYFEKEEEKFKKNNPNPETITIDKVNFSSEEFNMVQEDMQAFIHNANFGNEV